jgi:hypothetical protein
MTRAGWGQTRRRGSPRDRGGRRLAVGAVSGQRSRGAAGRVAAVTPKAAGPALGGLGVRVAAVGAGPGVLEAEVEPVQRGWEGRRHGVGGLGGSGAAAPARRQLAAGSGDGGEEGGTAAASASGVSIRPDWWVSAFVRTVSSYYP